MKALIVHWWDIFDRRYTSVHIVNNDEDIKRILNHTEIEDYEVIDRVYDGRGEDKLFE